MAQTQNAVHARLTVMRKIVAVMRAMWLEDAPYRDEMGEVPGQFWSVAVEHGIVRERALSKCREKTAALGGEESHNSFMERRC